MPSLFSSKYVCPSFLSIAVIDAMTKSSQREEHGLLQFTPYSLSPMEAKAGTESRGRGERLLTGLLSLRFYMTCSMDWALISQ